MSAARVVRRDPAGSRRRARAGSYATSRKRDGRGRRRDLRLCGGDREAGLASEGERDLLDGGGLGEIEDYVTAEEGGVDVDACASETEDVGGDMDLEVGVLVGLAVGHVVVLLLSCREELWRGREGVGIGVKGPQGSMEGGGERVFLWGRRRTGRAMEDIGHCVRSEGDYIASVGCEERRMGDAGRDRAGREAQMDRSRAGGGEERRRRGLPTLSWARGRRGERGRGRGRGRRGAHGPDPSPRYTPFFFLPGLGARKISSAPVDVLALRPLGAAHVHIRRRHPSVRSGPLRPASHRLLRVLSSPPAAIDSLRHPRCRCVRHVLCPGVRDANSGFLRRRDRTPQSCRRRPMFPLLPCSCPGPISAHLRPILTRMDIIIIIIQKNALSSLSPVCLSPTSPSNIAYMIPAPGHLSLATTLALPEPRSPAEATSLVIIHPSSQPPAPKFHTNRSALVNRLFCITHIYVQWHDRGLPTPVRLRLHAAAVIPHPARRVTFVHLAPFGRTNDLQVRSQAHFPAQHPPRAWRDSSSRAQYDPIQSRAPAYGKAASSPVVRCAVLIYEHRRRSQVWFRRSAPSLSAETRSLPPRPTSTARYRAVPLSSVRRSPSTPDTSSVWNVTAIGPALVRIER
ncbi:hypothetical protein BC628DRAFT_1073773 [Trametes gibbosa]|nr:hypothetical protein BC628DRAFT_1073773 [Trametes gibbosa]